jgi:hypothetical protein
VSSSLPFSLPTAPPALAPWTPGCAFALAGAIDQQIPGFVKQPGFEFPRRMAALVCDGLSCIPGALMGTR